MFRVRAKASLPGMILAAALCAALYWPGLHGGFFFDDEANILQREGVRLVEMSLPALRDAWNSGIAGPGGRPVAQISFGLNHYLAGFDPFVFKATNLVIHLCVAALVFGIARRVSPLPGFAALAAIIWLLHPIQATSVLYVVQRMTSLSAFFLLAGLLLHMEGRERAGRGGGWLLLALAWGLFWPLSFLSKETGALFPLFVTAWEVIIRRHAVGRLDRFAIWLGAVVGVGLAASVAYAFSSSGDWLWAGYELRGFSPQERLLTEGRVLWLYLGLLAFPRHTAFGIYHDDIPLSSGLLVPWTTLPAAAGGIVLLWGAWWLRRRAPVAAFGMAWFLVGHGLESTLLPLEIAHEHRNYLPSLGPVLIAAWAVARLVSASGWQRTLAIMLATVFMANAALVTGLRAHQYGDDVRRTQIDSQHHPESALTHYEAGRALVERLEIPSAESPAYFFVHKHYIRAGEIDPQFKLSWLGLIHLNCMVGRAPERQWIKELSTRLASTPFAPGDRNVLYGIKDMAIQGTLCLPRAEIEALFLAALSNPTAAGNVRAMLLAWLADYLVLGAHDLPQAEAELTKSFKLMPSDGVRLKLGQVIMLQGRPEEARRLVKEVRAEKLSAAERSALMLVARCLDTGDKTSCTQLRSP